MLPPSISTASLELGYEHPSNRIAHCQQCASSEVRKLSSIHSGADLREATAGSTASNPSLIAARARPPEKMANWSGFTLSLLLWTPIVWLPIFMVLQHAATGRDWHDLALGPAAFLTAIIVAVAVWSVPAFLQRQKALRYNHEIWRPAMADWHRASICLNCGDVYT